MRASVHQQRVAAAHAGRHRVRGHGRDGDGAAAQKRPRRDEERGERRRRPRGPNQLIANGTKLGDVHFRFDRAPRRPRRVTQLGAQHEIGGGTKRGGGGVRGGNGDARVGGGVPPEQRANLVPLPGVESQRFASTPRYRDAPRAERSGTTRGTLRQRVARVAKARRRARDVPRRRVRGDGSQTRRRTSLRARARERRVCPPPLRHVVPLSYQIDDVVVVVFDVPGPVAEQRAVRAGERGGGDRLSRPQRRRVRVDRERV